MENMKTIETLEQAVADMKEAMPSLDLRENESMRGHCSFRVGGEVRAFIAPESVWDMAQVLDILHENDVMPLMFGKGTNMIIPEEGLQIAVVSTENLQKLMLGEEEDTIYAEAGVSLARVAQFAQQNGLAGLEFASGIPGSVGGGVIMNAGAYGGEMKDVVLSVVGCSLAEQSLVEVTNEQCKFSYRKSIFEKVPCAVLSVVFKLKKDEPEAIAARMKEMNEKRREKQPLDLPSAGSAFKRPATGYAAALIDQCGLKGYTVGGAQVSEKHAGFVVNIGEATYDNIVELMDHVRREVYAKTEVTLEPELRIYPKGMFLVDDWRIRKQKIMNDMLDSAVKKQAEQTENKQE